KVEAGSITNSVNTKPYTSTGSNDNEGTGTVTFSTMGGTPMPVDVTPLEADASQFPRSRSLEPRWNVGQLINNPRDSLVTIIAYTRGEEYFSDTNSNGLRDPDEQFIDQGEPFVDSNDNGVWDVGETYIDEAPADGQWNGPNGTWDNDTTIWTETRILYTGRPVGERSFTMGMDFASYPPVPQPFSGSCGSGVGKGTYKLAEVYCADEFFNRPQAQGTTVSAVHSANKGSVQSLISGIQDGYGFGMERRKLNAANPLQDCTPATSACIWKMLFFDWGYGYLGQVKINGASASDTNPCQPDTLLTTCTVLNVGLGVSAPGAIE
ncbi:MAG TPA: hypothetical protein VLQ93_06840, partial [Myxococcaceae bacterium]|nr:hypothetical protein [Myxococcaceae bacterium]